MFRPKRIPPPKKKREGKKETKLGQGVLKVKKLGWFFVEPTWVTVRMLEYWGFLAKGCRFAGGEELTLSIAVADLHALIPRRWVCFRAESRGFWETKDLRQK